MYGFILVIIANLVLKVNTIKHMYSKVNTLTLKWSSLPEVIRTIPNAPDEIYIKGLPLEDLLQLPRVAIVGSRRVDTYGIHVTKKLASELAAKGIVIISGLALGVDSIAHQAALDSRGLTIAVLPSGIEKIYPASHAQLGEQITAHGSVLSETPGVYQPHEFDFLKRNRIISALSQVTIVTEAAARSGSLNTARHALEQGRVVMAVPGPINNPLCEGTNSLIKMGAHPVTCVEDVLRQLGLKDNKRLRQLDLLAQTPEELLVITELQKSALDIDQLAILTSLSPSICATTLSTLEIEGLVTVSGNTWSLS